MADPPPPPPRDRTNSILIADARRTLASAYEESKATGLRLQALQAGVNAAARARAALESEVALLDAARTSLRGEVEGLRETERERHMLNVRVVGSERAMAAMTASHVRAGRGSGSDDGGFGGGGTAGELFPPPPPLLGGGALTAAAAAAAPAAKATPSVLPRVSRTAPRAAAVAAARAAAMAAALPPHASGSGGRPVEPEGRWRG